ncbi:MAG: WG repeat-containing protein [Phycisphaerae bacterium]|nr:WG repeat-containing protein [Phycisphaerae bacterium]
MFRTFLLIAIVFSLVSPGCEKDTKSPPPSSQASPEEPAAPTADTPLPIVQDGLWGYIDADANVAIRPQYQRAERFSEDFAAVQSKGLWGVIDATGRMVISPQFEAVDRDGFSAGRLSVMLNGKWGLIDTAGQTVLPMTYATPLRFHENLAAFRDQDQFGFLDAAGQVVIAPQYTFAGRFSEGLAAVMTQGKRIGRRVSGGQWGYIDKSGKSVIEPQFQAAGAFSEGLAWVQLSEPTSQRDAENPPAICGYIDTRGQTVIRSKEYQAGREFSENRAAVRLSYTGLWGYIDRAGTMVIGAEFDQANDFHEGLAAVLTFPDTGDGGVKWGYIDAEGETVIPPKFDRADDFRRGFAAVWVDDKLGYIDREGRFLFPPAK